MELDEISYEKADGVAEITLDRPAQLNPISARAGGTRDQILWALRDAEDDPDIGCVLLKGSGSAFSAGGDLTGNARRDTAYEQNEFLERVETFHRRLRGARLPVVAAVHGYCLGAGLQLVTCCDLVIAAEGARFGVPEGRIGLVGASPLVSIVGRQWAKFLILTGELIDASRAREIGLVLTVERDDELVERARDLCRRLTRLPREALLLNKRTVDAIAEAAGDAAGRTTGDARDAITLGDSASARAPDGRTFRDIIDREGTAGMKAARDAQYTEPWLR
ncbi:MAG TPA: enoyl-CoA hydratase/isomerase family protein [Acidimicrobiales bacterium]|nr:enoyl-CoA hydratase/isomerase family protein [Acidimicrobiales bacterium]